MSYVKTIKEYAKKDNKKIGKETINKIISILEEDIERIIKKASRNADFKGRKIIKPEDIE